MDLLFLFEWLDTSYLASISKAYGGVFAVVQMFHLAAMAVMGGMVLASDLRLLNVLLKDISADVVLENTNRWFDYALVIILTSGIFMSSAVAMKLYYNEMFWAKMTGLFVGIAFVYLIRRPLFREGVDNISPLALKLVASSSIVVWFTVAASGRWIGFS
jgi:hypothetical protein|tara:strand:- start:150 stop:626 length:477 start_codon:yes stop_codon:yes gene_type:complete